MFTQQTIDRVRVLKQKVLHYQIGVPLGERLNPVSRLLVSAMLSCNCMYTVGGWQIVGDGIVLPSIWVCLYLYQCYVRTYIAGF